MRRDNRQLVHYGIPFLFLLAVTVVVLIVHGGFAGQNEPSTTSADTHRVTTAATTVLRQGGKVRLYTIQSGDTFGSIAIHFHVTVDDIIALNPGIEPTALRVGQQIKVKVTKASATP